MLKQRKRAREMSPSITAIIETNIASQMAVIHNARLDGPTPIENKELLRRFRERAAWAAKRAAEDWS